MDEQFRNAREHYAEHPETLIEVSQGVLDY